MVECWKPAAQEEVLDSVHDRSVCAQDIVVTHRKLCIDGDVCIHNRPAARSQQPTQGKILRRILQPGFKDLHKVKV